MNRKKRSPWPVPPEEVRHLCYRVSFQLAQESPRLDSLYPRLKAADNEAASRDLLSVLASLPVWESELPGIKPPVPKGKIKPPEPNPKEREVKIELIDVVTALLDKQHTFANIWNSIFDLIESGVVTPEILKVRFKLAENAKREMGCEADQIDYPVGRVVLRTTFKRFQAYLSKRERQVSTDPTAEIPKPRQTQRKPIPPKLRTRPMTLGEAAIYMGFRGKGKTPRERLKASMRDGDTPYEEKNRQSYIFNIKMFPENVQDKLR